MRIGMMSCWMMIAMMRNCSMTVSLTTMRLKNWMMKSSNCCYYWKMRLNWRF